MPTFEKTKLKLSNGSLMPTVELGCGPTPFVTIPGAGDGISTAYDAARSMAWFYRRRAPHQHMYI
ncbi:MAG: hypothetical protein L0G36_11695, partial [Brevibacterium sp.]|nr:hypothetical protein [Brevibacterium sp.]